MTIRKTIASGLLIAAFVAIFIWGLGRQINADAKERAYEAQVTQNIMLREAGL